MEPALYEQTWARDIKTLVFFGLLCLIESLHPTSGGWVEEGSPGALSCIHFEFRLRNMKLERMINTNAGGLPSWEEMLALGLWG